MDSISSLPDEIIGKILSLLPTKVAASTSVLSKRWRHLFCLVDNLCFDEPKIHYPISQRFCNFVDKMISKLSNSPMKKFTLRCPRITGRDHDRVNSWFRTAMERSLLEIHFHATLFPILEIDSLFLTNNTLVKLSLSHLYLVKLQHVFFPALNSLTLSSVVFDHDIYCQLLMGSPVLEELYISDCHINHKNDQPCLTIDSMRRLVISSNFPHKDALDFVAFRTPRLVYLDFSSYVSQEYKVDYMDMLVEARLNLSWLHTYFCDVTKLVAAITNITTLHLSPDSLEVLHYCCVSMPMFNNLLNLSIESNKEKGWQVIPLLLKSCPNLHTLIFKGLMHRVTNGCGDVCVCIPEKKEKKRRKIVKEEEELCCLWTCQVKVLEITKFGGYKELKQMKHFLGKLKCLETVKIDVPLDSNNNINRCLRLSLLALPRVSPKCSIQFI